MTIQKLVLRLTTGQEWKSVIHQTYSYVVQETWLSCFQKSWTRSWIYDIDNEKSLGLAIICVDIYFGKSYNRANLHLELKQDILHAWTEMNKFLLQCNGLLVQWNLNFDLRLKSNWNFQVKL